VLRIDDAFVERFVLRYCFVLVVFSMLVSEDACGVG
jgi:hypothetical protein